MSKISILVVILILILINISICVYGKIKIKAMDSGDEDKKYKASMKQMIISAVTSFITILIISILLIVKILFKN